MNRASFKHSSLMRKFFSHSVFGTFFGLGAHVDDVASDDVVVEASVLATTLVDPMVRLAFAGVVL